MLTLLKAFPKPMMFKSLNLNELTSNKITGENELALLDKLKQCKNGFFVGLFRFENLIYKDPKSNINQPVIEAMLGIAFQYFPKNVYVLDGDKRNLFWVFEGNEKEMLKVAIAFGNAIDNSAKCRDGDGGFDFVQGITEVGKYNPFHNFKNICEANLSQSIFQRRKMKYTDNNLVFYNGISQRNPDSFALIAKQAVKPFLNFFDKKWWNSDADKGAATLILSISFIILIGAIGVDLIRFIIHLWNHTDLNWRNSFKCILIFVVVLIHYLWFALIVLSGMIGIACFDWLDRKFYAAHTNYRSYGKSYLALSQYLPKIFGILIFIIFTALITIVLDKFSYKFTHVPLISSSDDNSDDY
jgi:hypothetical protein